jgi:hypothetical protein
MKVFGVVCNNNVLAVILGISIIIVCLITALFFQMNLFGKYRRKVSNTMVKDDPEDRWE